MIPQASCRTAPWYAKGIASGGSVFPKTNIRTIGDALNDKGISWAYYGGAYTAAVNLQHDSQEPESGCIRLAQHIAHLQFEYPTPPPSWATPISVPPTSKTPSTSSPAVRAQRHPARRFSFVSPMACWTVTRPHRNLISSKPWLKKILDHLNANQELFASTALIVTLTKAAATTTSGYIQPLEFLRRWPAHPHDIIVSPFTRGGHNQPRVHRHVSIPQVHRNETGDCNR